MIEGKWRKFWDENKTYKVTQDLTKDKFYCLDMFPYPSGAGLHVGHPRGYIASDVLSRFKRMQGYNVLHPMGYDAFGLPAEQYAIETGQHPGVTTENNINRFREQLDKIGFSFDLSREYRTCDPQYYCWTQWIFLQLFNSWYDVELNRSRGIDELVRLLEKDGNASVNACQSEETPPISAETWRNFSAQEQSEFLMNYRLAYRAESSVNWCPALGTVLANDEIKDGLSERGGHPVTKRKMKQWMLRITAFADRLLENLEKLDWPESLKEMQRNWIGKSLGCEIDFEVVVNGDREDLRVFTTRPDTVYGATFLVLAPEHPMVDKITTAGQLEEVTSYVERAKSRSDRERLTDVDRVSGVFTGAYASHPLTAEPIPVWIADYVLPEYGTGAIMAVPSADDRDYRFAQKFSLPLIYLFEGSEKAERPYEINSGTLINSRELDGLNTQQAKERICALIETRGKGQRSIKFRLRDAIFGRQRYWGEPIPIYYQDGIPTPIDEQDLPLELPAISDYRPTDEGEPPLERAENWTYKGFPIETTTMPGWAGSSWYFLRYMDASNEHCFADKTATSYWNSVDCYIGGSEHATGHLLYSRFWNLFLYDKEKISFEEPFQKIICQGMILGQSAVIYREKGSNKIISADLIADKDVQPLYVDISFVDRENYVDLEKLRNWRSDYIDAAFVLNERQKLLCERITEKMSKSKYNVVIPDDIIAEYGADCFRIHEMFLGPIDQSAPWSVQTIEGSFKFLKRVWRLFYDEDKKCLVSNELAEDEILKITHQTIKKVGELTDNLSFNTAIATLMTLVNSYTKEGVRNKECLAVLLQMLHPYAPFITEELWCEALAKNSSILDQGYPVWDERFVQEQAYTYPVSVNGKLRAKISLPVDVDEDRAKSEALKHENIQKWIAGKSVSKMIFVQNKIINLVVK